MSSRSTPSTRTFMSSQAVDESNRKQKAAKPPRKPRPTSLLPWLIVCLLIVLSASLFIAYKHAQDKLNGKTISKASLEKRVGKLIVLPQGEVPTVAVVNKSDKLHNQ